MSKSLLSELLEAGANTVVQHIETLPLDRIIDLLQAQCIVLGEVMVIAFRGESPLVFEYCEEQIRATAAILKERIRLLDKKEITKMAEEGK